MVISSYGGFLLEGEYWRGFPLIGCGGSSKGVGRISHNYRRAGELYGQAAADLMITVCDLWPLDAREFAGLKVLSWLPVDTSSRLGMPDRIQLAAAANKCARFEPVAMSRHGAALIAAELGRKPAMIPHMVAADYRPGSRTEWRHEQGISTDAFLVSTVGVNGDYPCRKGFPELLAAWQVFCEAHPTLDARLYMHTQISPGVEGVDLMEIARSLGLRRQVGWPDQEMRLADLHGPSYMAGMYRASDATVFASLGEGFCVPAAESMACGTPVIAARGSALTDRVIDVRLTGEGTGWLCDTQPSWSKLHNAWWHVPLVRALAECLEAAYAAREDRGLRRRCKIASAGYRPGEIIPQWSAAIGRLLEQTA